MSLISEALKKAQRARSPDLPAGTMAGFRRASGVPPRTVALIAVGAAFFFALVALVIVLVLRRGDQAALAAAKSAPAPAATSTTTTAPGAPTIAVAAAPTTPEATLPPGRPSPTPAPPPSGASATAAATKAPPPPVAVPTPVTGSQDARIAGFIDDIKIVQSLVRPDKAESKVMLQIGGKDFRIYRIGEIVDREMNIKLTGIEETQLTFADQHGVAYTKRN